jgi:hypothetical protein
MAGHPVPDSENQPPVTTDLPSPPSLRRTSHRQHAQTKIMRQMVAILVLVGGLAAGAYLVSKSQDLRQRAADQPVDVIIQPPTQIINQNDTFDIQVDLANTHNESVSAIDLVLDYANAAGLVNLTGLSPSNYFDDTSNNPVSGQPVSAVELLNDVPNSRLAIGAACDACYLGPNPGDGTPACISSPAPKCYAKTTSGPVIYATFTAVAPGVVNLGLDQTNSKIASIGSAGNVLGTTTGASFEVCPYGNADTDCSINLSDFGLWLNAFQLFNSNGTYTEAADIFDDDQINLSDFGVWLNAFQAANQ